MVGIPWGNWKFNKNSAMRLAIISDIHEDIISLRRVIGKIEKLGVDQIICLGDISGFSIPFYKYWKTRDAHECLSLLREKNSIIVPGNHDYHAAQMIPKNSAVFDFPDNWYDLDFRQRSGLSKNEIWLHEQDDLNPLYTLEDIEFLRSLPEYYVLNNTRTKILFSHYAYPNLSGFKKSFYSHGAEFKPHFEFMENLDCSISFTGHAHTRGLYTVSQGHFKHLRHKYLRMRKFPICIGIPPVAKQKNCCGFCKFDLEDYTLQLIRC